MLAGLGAASAAGLAGCSDDTDDEDDGAGGQGGYEETETEEEESVGAIQFSGPQGAAMTLPTRLIRDEGFAADRGLDLELEL